MKNPSRISVKSHLCAKIILLGALLWAFFQQPETALAQCNPKGNPSRREYVLTPAGKIHLVGQQYCTSASQGNGCCSSNPEYRCLDLVFHIQNGPNGELFDTTCRGQLNLTTAQGNFDALFFKVGASSLAGNQVHCAMPVNIGNNFDITLLFNGLLNGNVAAHLLVFNSLGVQVHSNVQIVSPGQSIVLTLCKPGFGCIMNDLIFGCCNASATLSLSSGAPATLCAGQTTVLKVAGLNGLPPYQVTVRAATATDTTYIKVSVPSDGDINLTRDTLLIPVSPAKTTTYCAVSVQDATGCIQPVSANHKATVTIAPSPIVNAGNDIWLCPNENLNIHALGASIQPNGTGVSAGVWSTSGTGTFLPDNQFLGAATYVPSAADRATGFVYLTLTSDDPPGPCGPVSDQVKVSFLPSLSLTCNNKVQVAIDQTGVAVISPDDLLEAPHLHGKYSVEIFVNSIPVGNKVDCSHIGQNVLGRVTDLCTGVRCSTRIEVVDHLQPKLTCTDITLPCAVINYTPAALAALNITHAYPQIDENCTKYELTHTDIWKDLTCNDPYIGYVLRTWTARDAHGNVSSCSQYIYFENRGLDAVRIPPNITLNCSSSAPDTSIMNTGVPFIEAYGVKFPLFPPAKAGACRLSILYQDKIFSNCAGSDNIVREWTVLDWCKPLVQGGPNANPRIFSQVISVIDQTGPTFLNCPSDLTVSTDALACCATVALPPVLLRDMCALPREASATILVRHPVTDDVINTIQVPAVLTAPSGANPTAADRLATFASTPCLPLGRHTVIYQTEDNCNNTSTCSFRLKVSDLTPPEVSCIEITQVSLNINGIALVNASTFDKGSYDACGPVYFKARRMNDSPCQPASHFVDQVKFCCEDIGDTIAIILRVYDAPPPAGPILPEVAVGNFNECMVQVYVEDKLKPTCTPPPNTTISCENFDPTLWSYGKAKAVDNCCIDTTITAVDYTQFDTLCNRGTIARIFRAVDCSGQTSTCIQRIVVTYQSGFFVRFPNDLILKECNDFFDNFGQPEFLGKDCEALGVSYEDQRFTVVPDACFQIERTWTIVNWCGYNPNLGCTVVPNPNPNPLSEHPSNLVGPTVSAAGTPAPWAPTVVRITPTDPQPTNFSTFWSSNPNCYKYTQIIKIRDTKKPVIQCPIGSIQECDQTNNDPQLWNASVWKDALTGSHDLGEGAIDLCISATDACSGPNLNVRFLLFLDLDNNGSTETVVGSTNPPPPGLVFFGNANHPNYNGGSPRVFDHRSVSDARKYRFALQTTVAGQNLVACLRWNTQENPNQYVLPELPYGTHKIKWFVDDGCGNEQVCEYTFTIKDCKAPTVVCRNGISVNLMPTKMVPISVHDLLQSAADNYTPSNLLIFGLRRSGTGTGFPFSQSGNPQTSVMFDCSNLGFNLVQLWVMDLTGNTDFCETFVHVQDNVKVCNSTNGSVAGLIQTESGKGLEDATLQLYVTDAQGTVEMQAITEPDGYYFVPNALLKGSTTTVKPVKNNDPLNGVSTFDLVLINRHILGIEPLSTPYKMIAADANNSRSITTFDIVELRKLILGLYTELPNNTSWRFVARDYLFPEPLNPFKEVFPERRDIHNSVEDHLSVDFIAIKVGDVNGNAITNSFTRIGERSAGTLLFDVEDRVVRRGEVFTVRITPSEPVTGYQFTLNHPGLELIDIVPGRGMSLEHFGIHPEEQAVTVSNDALEQVDGFSLIFRAHTDGLLRQHLQLSNQITKAEAYRADEFLEVALRFRSDGNDQVSGIGFELYQNRPNPWAQRTQISFHLPAEEPVTLTVYDETGRIRFRYTSVYARGYHTLTLDNEVIGPQTGALFYRLETPTHSAVRRMIRM
ncbi:MAG: hypothetical protein NZM43_08435 [Saprospiraceae bacterium]|nr:hypothetical protein [Saprospiraceae bacterium]MDW8484337.1 hypothetical protein [Saprospiraceae bacterium]